MKSIALALILALGAPAAVSAQAPAAAVSTASPARQALAVKVVAKLMPDGTYRRMMSGTMDKLMDLMVGQMTDMPLRDLAAIGGVPADRLQSVGPGTMKQMMGLLDPAFDERMRRTMKVTMDQMIGVMSGFEPRLRNGLARAYAGRFSEAQLTELDRFFATPTGSAYASQAMAIMADPAVVETMQGLMPELMQAMPGIGQKVQAATADLPKPKKPSEMTDAEKAKLKSLFDAAPASGRPAE
ncbi:DUF2059 domain-containing protein [Sphingomonas naphthae]|uniref:DUF2059 domain-containing protein n=1 Tax=Sphingomonas naphthae TaxID=1813468 RepID=A0ABY7TM14_9SPHN|nr:DUF2059 domain-containing protein [Sphingomonas naphthae]WCT74209.1 DUF2059 domain-containing protein [Sphingomonas naphthae]